MGNFKYYEKEVLSVSAGKTIELIEKYNIHAFPNDKYHKYKKFIFITFRRGKDKKNCYVGGEMETLYKVLDDTLVLDPNSIEYEDKIKRVYPQYSDRIIRYIRDRRNADEFEKKGEFKFYILSETEHIRLDKKPIPINKNNSYKAYYTLSELLSGKKKVRSCN